VRFAAVWLALIVFAAVAPREAAAADGMSLDALLARVRSATGQPYSVRVVSEAQLTQGGRAFAMHVESQGLRLLVRQCRAKVCFGEYFDGDRSFEVNMNGTALPNALHADDLQRVVRAIATCAFASPGFSAGGNVSETTPVARDGKTYRRLAVRSGDALLYVLIDPTTFFAVEAMTPDGRTAFSYRDFRTFGNLTMPFEIWRDGELLERYDHRDAADGSIVAPPGLAPAFEGRDAKIPMVHSAQPTALPIVACSVGGVAVSCLLDTGNSGLSMSLELAEQLGLEPYGEYEISGIGRYVTGVVSGGRLRVGNASYPAAQYVVLHDLHQLGYDVVLGADVFAHTIVTLDYAARTVVLRASTTPAPEATTTIPLVFEQFVPTVPVRLGAFDAPLALDTGDEAAINVSSAFLADHPGLLVPLGHRQVAGIGGTAEQVVGEIADARVATFDLPHVPIGETRAQEPAAGGHLGDGVLAHFIVTLDYARGLLGLTPRPGDAAVRPEP